MSKESDEDEERQKKETRLFLQSHQFWQEKNTQKVIKKSCRRRRGQQADVCIPRDKSDFLIFLSFQLMYLIELEELEEDEG